MVLPKVDTGKWILHADLDSFYASVEMKLHPELKGKPLIVGPNPNLGAKRGVVLTCSYEARKYGVRSAMPITKAQKLCPNAEYSMSGFDAYGIESKAVMMILSRFDSNLIRVSIDEAYLHIKSNDEYNNSFGEKEIEKICQSIQSQVYEELDLPISIGASHTKAIAKIASQLAKPKGVLVIPQYKFRKILDPLPLNIISGIGKKSFTALKQQGYGIIKDISKYEYSLLPNKHLQWIWRLVHGIQHSSHTPKKSNRSHSKERTFSVDISETLVIRKALRKLLLSLLDSLDQEFRSLTVKLRDTTFKTITRSFTFSHYINSKDENQRRLCLKKANELINVSFDKLNNRKFRLLGVKASNFKTNCVTQKSVDDFLE